MAVGREQISLKAREWLLGTSLIVVILAAVPSPLLGQASVHIPDPNLKAAVEDALWRFDPTPADMLGLRKLTCLSSGVTDITGLEYAKNLQSLNLHLNRIHDISPLSELDHLQKLDLSRNQIEDLSVLSDKQELHYLNLHGNKISDISALAELTNLENLVLRLNQISDISALSGLTRLTRLLLNENQINDISALSGLTNLMILYLYDNQIRDISALSGLSKLTAHYLHRNQISNISPLAGLINSTTLYLYDNQISDISPLSGMTKLSVLWLHDNPLDQQACATYIPQIRENNPGLTELRFDLCTAQYGLTLSASAGGSVIHPGTGLFSYAHGTSVPVIATTQGNHHFVSWTGTAVDVGKVADPNADSTTVTMDGSYTLVANFASDVQGYPSASTYEAEDVTETSVRLRAYLADDGGEACAGWFCYWEIGSQAQTEISTSKQRSLREAQEYASEVKGLSPGTAYRFQAIVENSTHLNEGTVREFTTLAEAMPPAHLTYVDNDAIHDPGPHDASLSDPLEDGTRDHPYDSIQQAIDQAQDLDKILVHEGRYYETLSLKGKCLEICRLVSNAAAPAAYPIIDAQNLGPVVTFNRGEDPNCILSGLILTGGLHDRGSAITCIGASPTIKRCLIVGNRSTAPAGAILYCEQSHSVFENCTIADNDAGENGTALHSVNANLILVNSILWGNPAGQVRVESGPDPVIVYTDVRGNWPGVGNIDTAPLFARPGYWADPAHPRLALTESFSPDTVWMQGDYHLLSEAGCWDPDRSAWIQHVVTSPCIDAGDPNSPLTDEPRPHGARINMGAYGGADQASFSLRVTRPVAHWTFDESSGDVALDSIGENHAAIHGTLRTEGILGGALQFDGVDDYVNCGNAPVLAPDQFTISLWICARATSASRSILRKAGGDADKDYDLELFGAQHPTFSFGDGAKSVVLYANTKLRLGEWTQIALTRAETEAAIHVNGTQLMSKAYDFAPSATDHELVIGGGFIQPYQGKIDDVQIYDAVLSAEEILDLVRKVAP